MDPMLIEIPDELETERLTIRVPRAGDGPDVNAAIMRSLDTLQPWMPWAKEPPSVEESESRCRKARAKFLLREDITLRLYLKGTRTVVGSSGLHSIDWSVPKFELGYWVGKSFEGQGYATEAVRGIATFALERLSAQRLEILVDERNERSRRIPERCGFVFEGFRRNLRRDHHDHLCNMRAYVRFPA
jgi:RimJ/RimL family protein N-acetyltransferase